MKGTQLFLSVILLSTFIPVALGANKTQEGFAFVFVGGITQGGDTLTTFDRYRYRDEDLDAGDGGYIGAGVSYHFPDTPFQLQSTIGYHGASLSASNGDAWFDRKPLEVMGFYHIAERHRVGFGASYHLNPEYEIDIDHAYINGQWFYRYKQSDDFDNALGAVIQYDYRIPSINLRIGARYTHIDYEWEKSLDFFGNKRSDVDGSYLGLTLQYDLNL